MEKAFNFFSCCNPFVTRAKDREKFPAISRSSAVSHFLLRKLVLRTKNFRQDVALYNLYVGKEKSSPTEYYCSLDAIIFRGWSTNYGHPKPIMSSLGFAIFGNCFNHCRMCSVFIEPDSEMRRLITAQYWKSCPGIRWPMEQKLCQLLIRSTQLSQLLSSQLTNPLQ